MIRTKDGCIGGWIWIVLSVLKADPHFISGPTILHHIFMVFQHMGTAATFALMMGAIAEGTMFSAMLRSVSFLDRE